MERFALLDHLQIVSGDSNILTSHKIGANLFEAILAGIYLDGGMEPARQFVMDCLGEALNNATTVLKDDKTRLYEYCQAKKLAIEYRLLERIGPDDKPSFKYALLIDGKQVAVGIGPSIKKAEQQAAQKIVTEWRID